MKNLKKWLTVIAACLVVLMLAGCPTGNGPQPGNIVPGQNDPNSQNNPSNSGTPSTNQQYTVTFKAPTLSSYQQKEVRVNAGNKVTRPADPHVEGFVFKGWSTSEQYYLAFDFNTAINADTTVFAKTEEGFTVKFNANGGTLKANPNIEETSGNELFRTTERYGKVEKPEDPERLNYVFDGWYQGIDESTHEVTGYEFMFNGNLSESTIGSNRTLYAKWLACNVTFVTNGGSPVNGQIVDPYDLITEPSRPTKEGFVFAGWYSDEQLTQRYNFNTYMGVNPVTLYAKWRTAPAAVQGLVSVNGNGSTIPNMYVSDHEVTKAEFHAVFENYTVETGYDNYPVGDISWAAAIAYCNKLSVLHGLNPYYTVTGISDWDEFDYTTIPTTEAAIKQTGWWNSTTANTNADGYRLPTKDEWTYLAKAGHDDYKVSGCADLNSFADYAWLSDNSEGHTHEVKTLRPNGFNLYDMSGNVYEYTFTPQPSAGASWGYANYGLSYKRAKSEAAGKGIPALGDYVAPYRVSNYGDYGFRIVRNK